MSQAGFDGDRVWWVPLFIDRENSGTYPLSVAAHRSTPRGASSSADHAEDATGG
jgi:hypothetical protein